MTTYIICEDFTTPTMTSLLDDTRDAEPGPGIATITDTDGKASIIPSTDSVPASRTATIAAESRTVVVSLEE